MDAVNKINPQLSQLTEGKDNTELPILNKTSTSSLGMYYMSQTFSKQVFPLHFI